MTSTLTAVDQPCNEQPTETIRRAIRLARNLLTAAAVTVAASESSHAALVAYYPLNGDANDTSGNGNSGIVHGVTFTTDRFGNADSAASFVGTSFISGNASTFPTAARTVDLWFDATTVSTRPVFFGYGGGACGTSFFVGLNGAGINAYYVTSHCDVNDLVHTFPSDPTGRWINFAATTDSSGTKIYVDGVLLASNTDFITNTAVGGTDFAIGVAVSPSGLAPYTDSNVGYFQGSLDDVRIYDAALSAEEICRLADGCAVPEPTSFALLGSGLLGLALLRRSKTA